eukprot:Lankesteria_metandrocarpae@DN10652_c0_g1_i1.p1
MCHSCHHHGCRCACVRQPVYCCKWKRPCCCCAGERKKLGGTVRFEGVVDIEVSKSAKRTQRSPQQRPRQQTVHFQDDSDVPLEQYRVPMNAAARVPQYGGYPGYDVPLPHAAAEALEAAGGGGG